MVREMLLKSFLLILISVLVGGWVGNAGAITFTGANCDTCTIVDDVIVAGTSALTHVSIEGALETLSGASVTIKNTAINGNVTLAENATTDQWAYHGTLGGAGTPSEAGIELAASPFRSATDLRIRSRSLSNLWCGGIDVGTTTDVAGKIIPYKGCFPIGAYRLESGSGDFGYDYGHH